MAEVAGLARVHQTTVSRALRNDPRISARTRRRVQRAAERLGYRPHPLVSALIALRRSRRPPRSPVALAFLAHTEDRGRRLPTHQYTYEAYLAGARAAAEQQGYQVDFFPLDAGGMTDRRLDSILAARNIPGIIIGALPQGHGRFTLDWKRYSVMAIEYTFTQPAFDRVVHDSYDGMRRIMAECRARGLRRVGLVLTEAGHERTEQLNGAAFWIEQKADRFFAPIAPLSMPSWNEKDFSAWALRGRLEAVVTSNALLPEIGGWKKAARSRGRLRVFNVNLLRGKAGSGIYQDPATIGATAARLVIEKIGRNERGVPPLRKTILTQGRWVEC
ncbi:MAG TPA: LacI family DNA-binding transcriptional regulator [Opitutaceae bacterium]|nr:LacI family DNA-binding transcriptional regulator [Opitutaceae bacterium]